tara:strand:+ start:766 stop:1434 length:669 start_codon:yes stop_codon:yes gene_type:complete
MNELEEIYNQEALEYDAKYQTKTHFVEDSIISSVLQESIGNSNNILDLGCGTGSVIDYGKISAAKYTGIDLSQGMIDKAIVKYKNHKFIHGDICNMPNFGRFDYVAAIYGQVNYVGIDCFCDVLEKHGGDNFRYMAVMYNQTNESDYGYTTGHQKHYSATEVYSAMTSRGFSPVISGFSWATSNINLGDQWSNTKSSGEGAIRDDWNSKYLIVTNFALGGIL